MVIKLNTTSPASLRAVFSFGQSRQVRIELDISVAGGEDRFDSPLSEIGRIIDSSRYHQSLDPGCMECDWYQVLNLIRRCHDQARLASSNLITSIRIEDVEGVSREHQASIMLAGSAAAVARA